MRTEVLFNGEEVGVDTPFNQVSGLLELPTLLKRVGGTPGFVRRALLFPLLTGSLGCHS